MGLLERIQAASDAVEEGVVFSERKGNSRAQRVVFTFEGIDCPNCAAKVEEAMKRVPGVIDVSVNFLTQKFTLEAADDRFDAILDEALRVGKKVEPDFSIER